jgi:hypothetical protein
MSLSSNAERVEAMRDAKRKATVLFDEAGARGLVVPGKGRAT